MPVPEDKLGPYILIAHRLRFTKDAPPREDTVLARPREGNRRDGWGRFLDDPDTNPTIVSFAPDDAVDIDALLRQGAIRSVPPAKPKRDRKQEADRGEDRGA